jgi:hypothetical protein
MGRPRYKMRDSIILMLSGLELTDDSVLDPEFVDDQLDIMRQTLIREAADAKKTLDDFYQLYPCLEVQCESASECEIQGIEFQSETKVLYVQLPDLIKDVGWSSIKYLGFEPMGPTDGFARKTFSGFIGQAGSRYTAQNKIYTVIGDRAFIKNIPEDTRLLFGIFLLSSPVEACDYNEETNYPVPSEYKLEMLTIKHILAGLGMPRDKLNDAMEVAFKNKEQND